jgi:hypothetical protein
LSVAAIGATEERSGYRQGRPKRNFNRSDKDSIPFFFTNIPDQASTTDLWRLFASFGYVGEVFMANKLDKWGRRFGFVKYREVRDVNVLADRLKEVWLWDTRLKVNKARFGREEKEVSAEQKRVVNAGALTEVTIGISFRNVLAAEGTKELMVREEMQRMEILPSEDMLQYLSDCFVGLLSQDLEPHRLKYGLVMEGLSQISVTGMGDRMVLLKVTSKESLESLIENHQPWWNSIFKEVKRWSPQLVAKRRQTWIHMHGIPLHVWDEHLFKTVGARFGVFIDFDEATIERKRLDFARIQISTLRKGLIEERVRIRVVGADYELWVVEEEEFRRRPQEEDREGLDDVSSRASREGDVVGRDEDCFSANEVLSPRQYDTVQGVLEDGTTKGKVEVRRGKRGF